jgi:hypothetical protein
VIVNKLLDAGFSQPSSSPFADALADFVTDADGNFWPKPPGQMSAADIFEYIEHRFGRLFVGFCKSRSVFTTH